LIHEREIVVRNRNLSIGVLMSASWLFILLFFALFGPLLPIPDTLFSFEDSLSVGVFSPGHILGTDSNGYDMFAQLVEGSRYSLLIAGISVIVGTVVGSIFGILAAFKRGIFDRIANALFSVVLSIPNLLLSITLIAVFGSSPDPSNPVPPSRRLIVVIVSLTIVIIPIIGRIARSTAMSWSSRDFVTAARSMGMTDRQIIVRHIVPNVLPALLAIAFLAIGVVIVAEGSLSLLGAGIGEKTTWGSMIARGRAEIEYYPHILFVPIAAVAFTVIACNRLGDEVRRSLDPREARL
jgi:peptide/nickel transport system permease protein